MAIIFVSIKKRQRIFFWGVSLFSLALVVLISFVLLVPEFTNISDVEVQEVFEAPDVNMHFDIIDSPQVQNLESFSVLADPNNVNKGKINPFQP